MKLKFKKQEYQTEAVNSVVDCLKGQPNTGFTKYRIDSGKGQKILEYGFKNDIIHLPEDQILTNIQKVQERQNLPRSKNLFKDSISNLNLDIEMETGTGKTYCYIKTIFEMNKKFGWTKFIVVVPSIAIREGVYKSLELTAEHFQEIYGVKAKFFIYNSRYLNNLESFSSDSGINVMIVNVQAFNARGKDNRRIYEKLDSFQSRRPIDIIKANNPILILDEPQKMEGSKTLDSLKEFNPLFILRYSATHKTQHNKVHRLDALDAYEKKLVKKITVRGITLKGLSGTNPYLYLESIEISKSKPVAYIEMEIKGKNKIKKVYKKVSHGENLHELSKGLDQYKGFVVSEINAFTDTVEFSNGHEMKTGEATGDVNEKTLRRIQIREAIKSHFDKEKILYQKGIKVLTLFFIDEVAKYRTYTNSGEEGGEYAQIFEEEYENILNEIKKETSLAESYKKYLDEIPVQETHNGYFSIDKKSKQMINPATKKISNETDDASAYDLILKDKERLLSFSEPTRFIFSHSALREGWDNPNVFVICTLKHSDNTISRRQEVGRGLRISVNQDGERQDQRETVHEINILTVIANESYKDFVDGLQNDISDSLSERPRLANADYFKGKIIRINGEEKEITSDMSSKIEHYLIKNDYIDYKKQITQKYYDDLENNNIDDLPEDLQPHKEQIIELIKNVYSDHQLPKIENDRRIQINRTNANFKKRAFKELWNRINHKAAYSIDFDTSELVKKCIQTLNKELKVTPLQYTLEKGEQSEDMNYHQVKSGDVFEITETSTKSYTQSIQSKVKYDLIGKISEEVQLMRKTVADILFGLKDSKFFTFKINPESFISETIRLIQEQKATLIIEHLTYDITTETYNIDIFTDGKIKKDLSISMGPLKKHIYDYALTDSKNEETFVENLDSSTEVIVYAKLPRGFFIPTPVGNYNPDWAIAFKEGYIKHIYFVAETKGSMSSMQLRKIEEVKTQCAHKFFNNINEKIHPKNVKYDVVDSFGKLMEIVSYNSAST